MNRFSFYRAPISNTVPHRTVGIEQIYNAIRGEYYRESTEQLRALCRRVEEGSATRRDVQRFKARHFDYATFSGEFTRRGEEGLLRHSGLICFDFDHIGGWKGGEGIGGVYGLRYVLSRDPSLDTVLLFRSPGGDGLKWVVAVDLARATHAEWFDALSCYVARNYGVETDPSGRDVARSCYLPWDPEALMLERRRL